MTTETTARPTPGQPKRRKKAKTPKKGVQPSAPEQLVPGYRGLIALALNSGQITSINAQAVHRNDRFDFAYGLNERLEHVPAEGARGEITHFYAYVRFKDGGHHFDVLTRAEVDAVRGRSGDPAWGTGYAEMGKEMAIRRIASYLPIAVPEAAALADFHEPADLPEPVVDAPAEESAPQAVDLTEEELAGLFPPGHVMRILDAASERDMPDEVLTEIAGVPIEEVSPEDESAILRVIASWQR
jgi:recombinational DNA repair protein RecT